jgi:diguanylate cyclase (GGDEF)-like protein
MASSYVLAALLFTGEMRPLHVVRQDGEADRITVSSTFAVALVLIGPLSLALLAQGLAVVVDDGFRRRSLLKAAFNAGQYAITLTLSRGVFCWLADVSWTSAPTTLSAGDLVPAMAAALVYFLVNNVLVAGVQARDDGRTTLSILRSDVSVQAMPSSISLGLAPVAAVAAGYSAWILPLLVLPLVGIQHSAWIAERRKHEALHDGLTGLPNRALFHMWAGRAISRIGDGSGKVGVMLLDLDHFKEVNDTLGHHVGDGLLRQVAGRLTTGVPDGVVVARLGGDEFAVLVPAADSVADVVGLAERLAQRLREPVLACGVRVSVQASVGIAVRPDHADSVETLLQRADIALYRAKDERGKVQVYRTEIDQHTIRKLSLVGDLHAAIENDEFELVYQPQVDAPSRQVVSVEALMRWRHPVHGMLSPDVFIPLAENTGAIAAMSRTAIAKALTTVAVLRSQGHEVCVAVNLSARLLSDLVLPAWVEQLLANTGVPARCLTIEVTESTITADPRRAMEVLQHLRSIGVRLSVDDFGIGYSSLAYLRRLRPDELKVDKSFVLTMREDENSAVIVRSTIELAHGLGLSVVAEGVEDQWTYEALDTLGADRIQGYHVARPMPALALTEWLDDARVPQEISLA